MNISNSGEHRNWRNVDLNLLVSFHYLYLTGSVSLAAQRAHITQSAMSHNLAKLRTLFNDPLFQRQGHKMQASAFAQQFAPKVAAILRSVDVELEHNQRFEPKEYQGQFHIGLTDYAESIFAPRIYDHLQAQAPDAQVLFHTINRSNYLNLFDKQRIDIAIVGFSADQQRFLHTPLYTETHQVVYDPAFIDANQLRDMAYFASMPHALVSPDGTTKTQVDRILAEEDLARQVTVTSANFVSIGTMVKGRALVATVPTKLAQTLSQREGLAFCSPPIAMNDFNVSLLSEKHLEQTVKMQWLIEQLSTIEL